MPNGVILRYALVAVAIVGYVLSRKRLKRRLLGAGDGLLGTYLRLKDSNPAAAQAALDEYVRLNEEALKKEMQSKRGRAAQDPKGAERYRQWLQAELAALAEAEAAPPDAGETPEERQENVEEYAKRRERLQAELDWVNRVIASQPTGS